MAPTLINFNRFRFRLGFWRLPLENLRLLLIFLQDQPAKYLVGESIPFIVRHSIGTIRLQVFTNRKFSVTFRDSNLESQV